MNQTHTHEGESSTFNVDYYYLSQDSTLAQEKLKLVPRMLNVFEKYFGPYPFAEDGFKLVQSPYPMEHQSCVAIGPRFEDQLILHESAHEWWGNNVSITDNADIWIHEAFATYAESLYIEETLGYELGQAYLNAKKSDILNDHPLVGIRNVNHFHYRIEDKYFKGALMLNTLRHVVNDDARWFQALKSIQQDFRRSFIQTEGLVSYLNEKLVKDLSPFFSQYLYTTQVPILRVETDDSAARCRWENVTENFEMSLKIGEETVLITTEWSNVNYPLLDHQKDLESMYFIGIEN